MTRNHGLTKAGICLVLVASLSAFQQQTSPIPAEEVTLRRQIYEDARVRVFLLNIPPGHATVMHRHDRDMLSVFVSGGKTRAVFDGRAPVDDTFAVGDVRFRKAGFTHSTENRDTANFLTVIFEFVQPQGERVSPTGRLCTAGFCVDEMTIAPGAVSAEAGPAADRMLVPLSGYRLLEQTDGGATIVHEKKRGEVDPIPAGPARRWTNAGPSPAHFVVVTFLSH